MNEPMANTEETVVREFKARPITLEEGEHPCNLLHHYHRHALPAWLCRWLFTRFMDLLDVIP
jgi:hypothetical protein